MCRALILAFAGAMGCASARVEPTADRAVLGGAGEGFRISGDDAKVSELAYPASRVWVALPAAYDSVGIPIGDVDSDRRIIGNTDFQATRQIGKVAISNYLDCGKGQGFQSADTYLIQISILTQVTEEKPGSTRLATIIQASAKPMAFGGGSVRCSTKYALETLISDIVRAQLRK
jgi:hypothetical protein